MPKAFRWYARSYKVEIVDSKVPLAQLEASKSIIKDLFKGPLDEISWRYILSWLYILLITLSGDVELNPGPKLKAAWTLSICHWNLSSICVHNFVTLSLLRPYESVHKFDIICLSEIYLDSIIYDESLEISRYYLISSDHRSKKNRGGICVY